jgi:DNA-binding CsgD family transcriptional regulator
VALRSLLDEGLALYQELGEKQGIANSYVLDGQLAFSQGNATTARSQLEEGIQLYREIGHRRALAEALAILARVVLAQGEWTEARAYYEESREIATALKDMLLIATCLEGRASMAAQEGQFSWATRLWGAAEALRESIRVSLPPIARQDYERAVALARTRLGEKAFTTAWREGHAMTPERAFASQEHEAGAPATSTNTAQASTYPAGLTAREVEVLRLVARGLTSGEIARELKISEKTVSHHLTHIFNKTISENRAAAVAFAIHHGLA